MQPLPLQATRPLKTQKSAGVLNLGEQCCHSSCYIMRTRKLLPLAAKFPLKTWVVATPARPAVQNRGPKQLMKLRRVFQTPQLRAQSPPTKWLRLGLRQDARMHPKGFRVWRELPLKNSKKSNNIHPITRACPPEQGQEAMRRMKSSRLCVSRGLKASWALHGRRLP